MGRFSFGIAVVIIFGKFLEKHHRQPSYSAVMSFQYVLYCGWFSRNLSKIVVESLVKFFKEYSWWDASDFI